MCEILTKEDNLYPKYFNAAYGDDKVYTIGILSDGARRTIISEARAVLRYALDNGETDYDELHMMARNVVGFEFYDEETGIFFYAQDFMDGDILADEESNMVYDAMKAEGM